MSGRPFKPPPESFAFQALKLVCTAIAFALIAALYLVAFWGVTLLHPPQWLLIPLVIAYLALVVATYMFLKWTSLGKYLCELPPYLGFWTS